MHLVPCRPAGTHAAGLPQPEHQRVPARRRRRGWAQWLKWVVEAALAVGGLYAVYTQRHQLFAAGSLLAHIRWRWLALAIVCEASSMVVFARLQRWLLRSGGVDLDLRPMVEITLAGDSLSVTLPGGVAWGASFAYEQLRRRGADKTLAGWVILVAGALSSFALFLIFAAGVVVAGARGPTKSVRWVVVGLALIPLVVGALTAVARRRPALRHLASRVVGWCRVHLPRGRWAADHLAQLGERLRAVQPSRWVWALSLGLALANWVLDCVVLVACIEALGLAVPWRGVLVAYSLAQISASLPITPGGIGVVEGSLSFALIAYGMAGKAAVASALLYRIVSFWGLIPVGWSVWAWLELQQRRGRREGKHHPWAWHHQEPGDDQDRIPPPPDDHPEPALHPS